ncbi:MAG TPA: DinB family protein [Bacteroidia bacterium]|jgi:hypothetical protein|nr:DinB family protein [Bacteroidia bacterium]
MNITDYIQTLDKHTAATLDFIKKSRPDIHIKGGVDNWNGLQILEHVCMTEKVVCKLVSKPSDQIHESAELFGPGKMNHLVVTKRAIKVKAPEMLNPKGDIQDLEAFEQLFTAQRNELKENLMQGTIPVDNRIHKHPYLGEMTISDWLYFMIAHTQRHLEQIGDHSALNK